MKTWNIEAQPQVDGGSPRPSKKYMEDKSFWCVYSFKLIWLKESCLGKGSQKNMDIFNDIAIKH